MESDNSNEEDNLVGIMLYVMLVSFTMIAQNVVSL